MADWDQVRQGWADFVVNIIVQFTLCCHDFFFSKTHFLIFAHGYWQYPGVDSACNRNEYHEYFLGVKAAGA